MKPPRIVTEETPSWRERITATTVGRYGFAIVTVACAYVISIPTRGQPVGVELSLLWLYSAALLSSVFSGLGPGLLATGLSIIVARLLVAPDGSTFEIIRIAVEGCMLSIVGGTLRSAREKANQRLKETLDLEQQILEISDDERRRIGHDLHDGLGQHLTGISLLSEAISQQMESGSAPNPATAETITHLASQSVQITRDLAKSLSPVTLEQDGLIAAVEELLDSSATLFGIKTHGELDEEPLAMDRARSLHLYRIIQEAVNNSVRHGKAKNVTIHVRRTGQELRARVIDDGSGLSAKTMNNPGIGLRIMQYRARMLGATLSIERATQQSGTIVTCTCPMVGPVKA